MRRGADSNAFAAFSPRSAYIGSTRPEHSDGSIFHQLTLYFAPAPAPSGRKGFKGGRHVLASRGLALAHIRFDAVNRSKDCSVENKTRLAQTLSPCL